MSAVLSFEQMSAFYGLALVVDRLTLAIEEGECLCLLGPNGVGKTTTLNAIFGIARIGHGAIKVDGKPIRGRRTYEASRAGAALVPQGRWIIPSLSVEENLLLGAAASRSGQWTLRTVYQLLPELDERRKSVGTTLSGGQQQMLAIGRALMANPRVLLLDEPTEGLAPIVVERLGECLGRLKSEGMSMLLIEQRLDLVTMLSDRYAVMSKGRLTRLDQTAGTPIKEFQRMLTP